MSGRDSDAFTTTTVVRPADAGTIGQTRYQTERPPPRREGVVSDPDQYFPDTPPAAEVNPPGCETPAT